MTRMCMLIHKFKFRHAFQARLLSIPAEPTSGRHFNGSNGGLASLAEMPGTVER